MKCEYCAGNISIEDAVCPFCNATNPYYEAHRADMKAYQKQYEKTKREVVEKNRKFSRRSVLVTIIAIMVSLCFVAILLNSFMWDINYSRQQKYNKRHAAEYAKELAAMEEKGDYLAIADMMDNYYSYYSGSPMEEYSEVGMAASKYAAIVRYVGRYVDDSSYYEDDELAKNITTQLGWLYEYNDKFQNQLGEYPKYSEKHAETMADIINETNLLLETYLGIDEETLEDFPQMTTAKRQLILEEAIMEVTDEEQ